MPVQVFADASPEELTKAEQGFLPILQLLSMPDTSKLLSIVTDPAFRPKDAPWNSMRAVNAYLVCMYVGGTRLSTRMSGKTFTQPCRRCCQSQW